MYAPMPVSPVKGAALLQDPSTLVTIHAPNGRLDIFVQGVVVCEMHRTLVARSVRLNYGCDLLFLFSSFFLFRTMNS